MAQAQAMEKQQRDAVMMQKANANAKKAAAQKAEAINMANKVVSDAEKHTEAVKSAKAKKFRDEGNHKRPHAARRRETVVTLRLKEIDRVFRKK